MNLDVADLARDSFGSVWALEILVVLHRDADRSWTRSELITELRSSEVIVNESIDRLSASGLVSVSADGSARYSPATENLRHLVPVLIDDYLLRPAAVRRLIVQGSADKLRSFANAFRLRPE